MRYIETYTSRRHRGGSERDEQSPPTHGERREGRRHGGRRLGHGDLRLLLLALIEQQPRHGYELIRLIGDMFHGLYVPSPGAVYPVLAALETQGLAIADNDGKRKRHALTDAGRAFLQENRDEVEQTLARTARSARGLIRANLPQPVREALERIKRGLGERHGRWDDAEVARVAALLDAAADAMERADGT